MAVTLARLAELGGAVEGANVQQKSEVLLEMTSERFFAWFRLIRHGEDVVGAWCDAQDELAKLLSKISYDRRIPAHLVLLLEDDEADTTSLERIRANLFVAYKSYFFASQMTGEALMQELAFMPLPVDKMLARPQVRSLDVAQFALFQTRQRVPLNGSMVAIYGPNATGKTTILNALRAALSGEVPAGATLACSPTEPLHEPVRDVLLRQIFYSQGGSACWEEKGASAMREGSTRTALLIRNLLCRLGQQWVPARFWGEPVYLSQGQRQLLALTAFMANALLADELPLGTVVIDNPFQILDDVGHYHMLNVLEGLMERGLQVVFTTANKDLYRTALRRFACYQNDDPQVLQAIRIRGVSQEGPVIEVDAGPSEPAAVA